MFGRRRRSGGGSRDLGGGWCISLGSTLVGAVVLIVSFAVAPGVEGALGGALGLAMMGVASADARRFIVPNPLSGGAFALGAIRASVATSNSGLDTLVMALSRAAFAAGLFLIIRIVYRRLRQREGLGLGDVKLAAVAGVWLSWPMFPVAVEFAAISGLVRHAARQHSRTRALRAAGRVPFGAVLAPAIWLAWVADMILQTT